MKSIYFIIITLTCSLIACNTRKESSDSKNIQEYYDLSKATPAELTKVFEDVELIPLLFDGDEYPSQFYTMNCIDSLILLQDYSENIYVFTREGHYKSSSKLVHGQGPGEIDIFMGYSWNPFSGTIQVLTPNKMLCYDTDFNFVEECALPGRIDPTGKNTLLFTQIYDLSENNHLLTPFSTPFYKDCYVNYNSKTGELGDTIDYSKYIITYGNMQSKKFFQLNNNEYLVKPPFIGDYIYSFNPNELSFIPKIKFDMGAERLTKEEVADHSDKDNQNAIFEYLGNSDRPVVEGAHPTPDKIFFYISHGNRFDKMEVMVANRKSGEINKFKYRNGSKFYFPPMLDMDNDYVYSGVTKLELIDSPDLLLGENLDLDTLLKDYDDDTLIVLKYKIKK